MKYNIIRTDKADEGIRHTVLYLANHFGNEFALEKLDYIENTILLLEDNPYIGRRIDDNIYKYVMLNIKSVLYYEIHEDSNTIIIFDLKAFKENRRKKD